MQAHRNQHGASNQACEVNRVIVPARFMHLLRVFALRIEIPAWKARRTPRFRRKHIAGGGNKHHCRRNILRVQAGNHQTLLPALALAGDNQHFAVPIRAVCQILDGTVAGQVYSQIIALVAVVIADVPVVMQRAGFLLLIIGGPARQWGCRALQYPLPASRLLRSPSPISFAGHRRPHTASGGLPGI